MQKGIRQDTDAAQRGAAKPGAALRYLASSGVPLSEMPAPRGTFLPAASEHDQKLTVRQLSAHHLQRVWQLQRSEPHANSSDWSLRVRSALNVYLVLTSSQNLSPPSSCLVQEGEDIAFLGGTSKS
jgi:hypothetical protein